jgi:iron complex transport system ATP-binding protein
VTVELANVSVAYDGHRALQDVSVHVRGGAWLALIGPNGAGKTTLLRAVAGLVPFSGHAQVVDAAVEDSKRRRLARLVAYVPQRPELPAAMTVSDYVLLGRTPYIPYLGTEGMRDLKVVARVLERLEMMPMADRPLGSLSGGEGQRAVLARALAQEAPVMLLDEPTAALDVGHQQEVLELVDELRREDGITVVAAMHDLTLAGQFAERLLLLDRGKAITCGPAAAVLDEATIRRHYGASVRILVEPDGSVSVLPVRPARGGDG